MISRRRSSRGPRRTAVYVDVDLDVVDRAAVPGCPAAVPGGLTADELRCAARLLAGATARVRAIDVTEVDVERDADDERTVRLAALVVLEALAGLARRRPCRRRSTARRSASTTSSRWHAAARRSDYRRPSSPASTPGARGIDAMVALGTTGLRRLDGVRRRSPPPSSRRGPSEPAAVPHPQPRRGRRRRGGDRGRPRDDAVPAADHRAPA